MSHEEGERKTGNGGALVGPKEGCSFNALNVTLKQAPFSPFNPRNDGSEVLKPELQRPPAIPRANLRKSCIPRWSQFLLLQRKPSGNKAVDSALSAATLSSVFSI